MIVQEDSHWVSRKTVADENLAEPNNCDDHSLA